MRRLIIIPVVLLLHGLMLLSCDKYVDKDYFDDDEPEKDFIIRNDLDYSMSIVVKNASKEGDITINIPCHDSIVRESCYIPFSGDVFVVIDDTLVFHHDTINRHYNVGLPSSYDTVEVGDNYYKMRYVIDEDFYEYAKAHPYMGE